MIRKMMEKLFGGNSAKTPQEKRASEIAESFGLNNPNNTFSHEKMKEGALEEK